MEDVILTLHLLELQLLFDWCFVLAYFSTFKLSSMQGRLGAGESKLPSRTEMQNSCVLLHIAF